jgi:hypothetical protein
MLTYANVYVKLRHIPTCFDKQRGEYLRPHTLVA